MVLGKKQAEGRKRKGGRLTCIDSRGLRLRSHMGEKKKKKKKKKYTIQFSLANHLIPLKKGKKRTWVTTGEKGSRVKASEEVVTEGGGLSSFYRSPNLERAMKRNKTENLMVVS